MNNEEMQERIESLENDVEYWEHEYYELLDMKEKLEDDLDELKAEIEEKDENKIHDVINFKRQLEIRGLMTPVLDEFIEDYMRWSNEQP